MEIVEGETLRARLTRGAMPIDDILSIGTQVAAALAAAHKSGIVHRDIKPENVMITPDGYAKVLDFGLAKLREIRGDHAATLVKTKTGIAVGTLLYMSPEQLSGGEVGPPSDVYSLGLVLYEMLHGHRPVDGGPATTRTNVPPKLNALIAKALAKNPSERYGNAGEMLDALRSSAAVPSLPAQRKSVVRVAIAALVVTVVAVGVWMMRRHSAEKSIKLAEEFLAQKKMPEAYQTAIAAASILPANERLRDVIAQTSDQLSVDSEPPGAAVLIQRFKGPEESMRAGTTPLKIRLPRADYILTLEKHGYAPVKTSVSMSPFYLRGSLIPSRAPAVRLKLIEAAKAPPGMVFVGGGEYSLTGYARPSDRVIRLRDFFIDRYEVSNKDFEEFVRAGGYRRGDLWKHPFVDGGKKLGALCRQRDRTQLDQRCCGSEQNQLRAEDCRTEDDAARPIRRRHPVQEPCGAPFSAHARTEAAAGLRRRTFTADKHPHPGNNEMARRNARAGQAIGGAYANLHFSHSVHAAGTAEDQGQSGATRCRAESVRATGSEDQGFLAGDGRIRHRHGH
jgi:hypothetical protein